MLIVDSQAHIWAANTPERPRFSAPKTHRTEPLHAQQLLREMNAAGVTRAILVPPGFDGPRNVLILAAAQRYPDRFAAMGRLDTKGPDAKSRIASWREQPGMLGMRFSFNRELGPALADGQLDWVWEEAQNAGIPIMALVPHDLIHLIDSVAERYPALKLVLCHLGLATDAQDEEAFREFDKLLVIARRPNVSVKASVLPTYTRDAYPFRSLHPYLRQVYDAFGPQRIFWETDFSRLTCSYREAIILSTEELPWLAPTTKSGSWGARCVSGWIGRCRKGRQLVGWAAKPNTAVLPSWPMLGFTASPFKVAI